MLTNLLEVLFPCKYTTNLIKFDKIDNDGAPLDCFLFPTIAMASLIDGNGIFVRVAAGVVAILTIVFANIDAPVVVDFLSSMITSSCCSKLLLIPIVLLQANSSSS
jgi:hypothetical protein